MGAWDAIAADVSPELTPEMRNLQEHLKKDGVRRVDGPGELRHDCPPAPSVDAGKDCFAFRLSGSQVIPLGGVRKLNATLRLWVERADGGWEVNNYDYALTS